MDTKKKFGPWKIFIIIAIVLLSPFIFVLINNLARFSGAMKRFETYKPAFNFFMKNDNLLIDGTTWKMSDKKITKMNRLVQYVPTGQSFDSSTESFLFLEIAFPLGLPEKTFKLVLNQNISTLRKNCSSAKVNLLSEDKNLFIFEFLCKEDHSYYSVNGLAYNQGVVSNASFARDGMESDDLTKIKSVWVPRLESLVRDGVWR